MASKARAVKTSKSEGGGKKGSKRDPPQKTEKTSSSGSASADESEVKKSTKVKEKVDRPKKEKVAADRDSDRDDDKVGRDEKKKEADRDKRIWSKIEEIERKFVSYVPKNDYKIGKKAQKEKVRSLEVELKILIRTQVKEPLSRKVEALEKKLDISQDEVQGLRESFGQQLEDFQSAGKADDNWKEVEEKMMNEMKDIKFKLGKRMKKKEMSEVILNLKEEVNELKKLIDVKVSTQYSTPTPVKVIERPYNNGGWKKGGVDPCPVHSPEVDWWKRKRKWCRPLWCDTHGKGVHTTSMCWNRKKVWRIKKKVEGDLGGSPTASPTTKKE